MFKVQYSMLKMILASIALMLLSACAIKGEVDEVAEQFMERYYVRVNLQEVKSLVTDRAAQRIEEELNLTAGVASRDPTGNREVSYTLWERGAEESRALFVYKVRVATKEAGSSNKMVFLSLDRVGGTWKIGYFRELEDLP